MSEKLSHINDEGNAHMVDVSDREVSQRSASASGKVLLSKSVLSLIAQGTTPKGDVLATARIAGIMGAKKTSDLIPLCHPISISSVNVDLEIVDDGVQIYSTVKISDRTGVEMEALTAVSIAALTIIDMTKALDPGATIKNIQVDEKDGGRNGHWKRT
jgi:cyclic pyranopterin phosphate synthase